MTGKTLLDLDEIDKTQVALAGGKGANLGELARIEGVRVPAGFCVTTDAFRQVMATVPGIGDLLARLPGLDPDDRQAIRALSAEIRRAIEGTVIPDDLATAITAAVAALGEQAACAVRSSATAEDLPTASFAGQQDSYLNVTGSASVLEHVSRCWASLFTERAVTYRQRNGFGHRTIRMAVVVQRMVFPQASGVLFTVDPLTSNRKVTSIEAVPGLAEALVSGLVTPDSYRVRDGEVTDRVLAGEHPALTGAQVMRLAELGRRIEAHFGQPQDIEWCLAGDEFLFVQSRPVTTLFPVPQANDAENHVYLSVGHQQMMTDAMKPLGLSVWLLTTRAPMTDAGGRLFVDATKMLSSSATRASLLQAMRNSDPLMGDALATVLDRGDFIPVGPDDAPGGGARGPARPPAWAAPATIETDPAVPAGLIEAGQAANEALRRDIEGKSGPELLDFIRADFTELQRILFHPRSSQAIMAGMQSAARLGELLGEWLGEKNAVDILTQSAPGNVTAEMGLDLLDVADVIRPHPDVVAFLEHAGDDENFLGQLPGLAGGRESRDAIEAYLDKYGMRCIGEIDITRPRWSERPATLVPMILGNIRNFAPGAGQRRFADGQRNALEKEREVLSRLRELPDGAAKAEEAKGLTDRIRTFAGYREYPKYFMISRYFTYKQALLAEAGRLVKAGVLREAEDIFYLRLAELADVVRASQADHQLIDQRKAAHRSYEALTPPRVLTSDGEALTGAYRRSDVPAGALAGLPVSAGTVEGRARVVLDMADADLEAGDILVTAYTDPSWTPAFVAVRGLVTEVGGLMTHGAVIAREYGLPAVVGVEHATRLIRDGQRIRVHGTDGYVEILS
jgi:pyruvate,water dikinase